PLQRPHPPIMIGGGGPRLLAAAGRRADIVQIMPRIGQEAGPAEPPVFGAETYAEKIGWVRDAAGDRFACLGLGAQLLDVTVTDAPDAGFEAFYERFARRLQRGGRAVPAKQELRASPMLAIGPLDEVCDRLRQTRDLLGIGYFAAPIGAKP